MFPWASCFLCLHFLIRQVVETVMGLLHRAVGAKTEDVAGGMEVSLSVEQELPSPVLWHVGETTRHLTRSYD